MKISKERTKNKKLIKLGEKRGMPHPDMLLLPAPNITRQHWKKSRPI